MRLKSISYSEFVDRPQEWRLDGLSLGPINLLVGKNASGKTRALNIIGGLARHLVGLSPPSLSGFCAAHFENNGSQLQYELHCEEGAVTAEKFTVDGKVRLNRNQGGEGVIFAEKIGKDLQFQTPTTQLAVVARRDVIQHKFLEPLYEWATRVRHFQFGTSLGKDRFTMFMPKGGATLDERDTNAVVGMFRKAEKEFGEPFMRSVKNDMLELDYPLESVQVGIPVSIQFRGDLPADLEGLNVKECNLPGVTDQNSMSQGMFRALSIVSQLNYFHLKGQINCVLIDDVGEGLDFDRSCRLIELLRQKATAWAFQLIMSTNDRFVMNNVPLDEWSVICRNGAKITVRNHVNSSAAFEEFKFTGLNNFDFFATDFLNDQLQEEPVAHE